MLGGWENMVCVYCLVAIHEAQLLLDTLATCLVQVGGLDVLLNAVQLLLDCGKRGGVEHFVFDLGLHGTPEHQEELLLQAGGRGPLALMVIGIIVYRIAALLGPALAQILQKLLVVSIARSDQLHANLALILDDKDRIAMALRSAYLLEDGLAIGSYLNSRSHSAANERTLMRFLQQLSTHLLAGIKQRIYI